MLPLIVRVISGTKRKFQANWIKENPWLRYSENTDSVYCVYCVLFAPKEKANLTFSFLSPVNNWSNMSQLLNDTCLKSQNITSTWEWPTILWKFSRANHPLLRRRFRKLTRNLLPKTDMYYQKSLKLFCSVVARIYLLEAIDKTTAIFMQFCIPWPKQTQS